MCSIYSAPPDPLAGFEGPISKEREGEGTRYKGEKKWRKRKARGRKGEGEREEERRGCYFRPWRPLRTRPVAIRERTYSSQSTATMYVMSSGGRPTADRTRIIVTRPALGTLAAPILASVAVRLHQTTQ